MTDSARSRPAALRVLALLALPLFLAAIYLVGLRPSQLHWGATTDEVQRQMPGDLLVLSPSFNATRAITMDASPKAVWPWLAQMGYRRAGFYGYDLIENIGSPKGIRSAETILPDLQHPATGDILPISVVASMYFGEVQPGSFLVWRGAATPSDGTIVWAIYPLAGGHTRLARRVRLHYHWTSPALLFLDLFTEFADHVAVSRILRGIKARAEGKPLQPLWEEAAELLTWAVALGAFSFAAFAVLKWRRWGRAWLLAFAAGLLLQFDLYAHAPAWAGGVLTCGLLAAIAVVSRQGSQQSIRQD